MFSGRTKCKISRARPTFSFSELKAEQVRQSFFEVSDKAINVDDFVVVFEGFQHDSAVFGGDVVDCLAQVDWVEAVLPPEFKQILSETERTCPGSAGKVALPHPISCKEASGLLLL